MVPKDVPDMTVTAIWDNDEKTIVRYIFEAGWTWDEFFAAKKRAHDMMDTVTHKFGVILHMPAENVIHPDILANARNGLLSKHANTSLIVVVSTRPFIRTMIETLVALAPLANTGLETAATLDEARLMVNQRLHPVYNDN
jgi:hypothetical protein